MRTAGEGDRAHRGALDRGRREEVTGEQEEEQQKKETMRIVLI